jgi:RNA polymerase sigma factor (sigma-70 family)
VEEGTTGFAPVSDQVSVERLEHVIHLRAMLQRLTPRKREVLRLQYHEGFTVREIATILETSPGYAQRLVSKALRDLRSMHQVASSFPRKE